MYQQVDKGLGLLPEAELDARYSVLESTVGRYGTPEHWVKINNKLKLLGEEDKRISFWIISGDPHYEYGNLTPQIRAFAQGPLGMRDLKLPDQPYPLKVLVSQFPAKDQRPPLRFMIGIDTETFFQTQHHLLIALISLAIIGVLLASALGYWVARIGLKPLIKLSQEAQRLAPPLRSGRLRLSLTAAGAQSVRQLVQLHPRTGRTGLLAPGIIQRRRRPRTALAADQPDRPDPGGTDPWPFRRTLLRSAAIEPRRA